MNSLSKNGMSPDFLQGFAVMEEKHVTHAESILYGSLRPKIVTELNNKKALSIGLSGRDGNLITGQRMRHLNSMFKSNVNSIVNLGLFGEVTGINRELLFSFIDSGVMPVISPIITSSKGEILYADASSIARKVAEDLGSNRMILFNSDVFKSDQEICMNTEEMKSSVRKEGGNAAILDNCIRFARECGSSKIVNSRVKHSLIRSMYS